MHIRRNDTVMVMTGRDQGKTGKVLMVFPGRNLALVEGVGKVKRHQRPTAKLRQGGIIEKELPLRVSNLLVYCPQCKRGTRMGTKAGGEGKKVRVCRKCKTEVGS